MEINMPTSALCPKCQGKLHRVEGGHIVVDMTIGKQWNGVAYACPHCKTLLGIQIDPVAIKNDTVTELHARLRT